MSSNSPEPELSPFPNEATPENPIPTSRVSTASTPSSHAVSNPFSSSTTTSSTSTPTSTAASTSASSSALNQMNFDSHLHLHPISLSSPTDQHPRLILGSSLLNSPSMSTTSLRKPINVSLDILSGSSSSHNIYDLPSTRSGDNSDEGDDATHEYSSEMKEAEEKKIRELRKNRKRAPSYSHCYIEKWPTYRPIEEHGLIGNMRTCAMISTDAQISWYCYPHFDSPSIFASILDREKGGHFSIRCAVESRGSITHRQLYHSETNVLISRFLTDSGVGQVSDFMPVGEAAKIGHGWLIRELEVVRGKMYFEVECCPAFNYARDKHQVQVLTHGARFKTDKLSMVLTSGRKRMWKVTPDGGVLTKLKLVEGQKAVFIFRESKPISAYPHEDHAKGDVTGHPASFQVTDKMRTSTIDYWRNWISKCTYTGRWREAVYRSALVLKLLTFEPTGAIVAAATTSLPETMGGSRNWDYRFTWIRDSSFVLYAFLKLGFKEEAAAFMKWVAKRCFGRDVSVMLSNGDVKFVQDVVVGDLLMGDDNTCRRVVSLSRGNTGEDAMIDSRSGMYEIKPVSTSYEPFTCNSEHRLVVVFNGSPIILSPDGIHKQFRVRWIAAGAGDGDGGGHHGRELAALALSTAPSPRPPEGDAACSKCSMVLYASAYDQRHNRKAGVKRHEAKCECVVAVSYRFSNFTSREAAQEFITQLNWQPLIVEVSVADFLNLSKSIQDEASLFKFDRPLVFDSLVNDDSLGFFVMKIFGQKDENFLLLTSWLIGMWLADGVTAKSEVIQIKENADKPHHSHTPVVDECVNWYRHAYNSSAIESDVVHLRDQEVEMDGNGKPVNPVYAILLGPGFRDLLQQYGILSKKSIPSLLMKEAVNIRAALFAGMIDGDGYYDPAEHQFYFPAKDKFFIQDVIKLARTLGLSTGTIMECSYMKDDGNSYNGFATFISGNHISIINPVLTYKRPSIEVNEERVKNVFSTSFTITRIDHANYYGFEVEGSNHRILLADGTVSHNCEESSRGDGSLQIMYGINGEHTLTEETLDDLEGYQKSSPVRIGNGAYNQSQLDIYGELLDTVYLSNKYAEPISYEFWLHVRKMVDWVCEHWGETDEGIWEVRGGQQHFVYSKVMSWVALDRGIRLAERRSFPADLPRWYKIRNTIYEEIQEKGWNKKRQAFTQYYGSDTLDASCLIMPLVFFMSPTDPRFISTFDNILSSVADDGLVSNNLVFRYNVEQTQDGMSGEEGTFSICTFWACEAGARLGLWKSEYLEKARMMFEQMLGYANHLGLYSEEIGRRGEHLGNFPQAFTHLALISAALNLDRALNAQRGGRGTQAESQYTESAQ